MICVLIMDPCGRNFVKMYCAPFGNYSLRKFTFSISDVFSQVIGFYYEQSSSYRNILPSSDLNLAEGPFSLIKCATLCVHQKSCQTIFYKPLEMTCSLYNYPLTEFTETFPESGIEVYKMEGCSRPGFDVIREIGMCVQIYHTTNLSYTYAMEVCRQEGGELISLDTGLKMNIFSSYLFFQFGRGVSVSVGLENSSGWKWVNGQPLAIGHLNVTNNINNYDTYKDPCDSNYCGLFAVSSSKSLKMHDNCCNNIKPYFVCSIPFKH